MKKQNIKYFTYQQMSKIKNLPLGINRPVDKNHVRKIMKLIQQFGIRGVGIVVYTDIFTGKYEYYIIDWQHTRDSLVSLEAGAYWQVIKCNSRDEIIREVAFYNNSSKGWSMKDFLFVWANSGKDAYQFLVSIYNENHLNVSSILECFSVKDGFKQGRINLSINQKERGKKILTYLNDLALNNPSASFSKGFIRWYRSLMDDQYNHTKVKRYIENNPEVLYLNTYQKVVMSLDNINL